MEREDTFLHQAVRDVETSGEQDHGADPPVGKWSGRLVSASAGPSDDQKYDAIGEAVINVDHGDGTHEMITQKEGRRRDTKAWETYRNIDPGLASFAGQIETLVEKLNHMKAMREIGGNIVDHADSVIAIETAFQSLPPNPPESCSGFVASCRRAIKAYKVAIEKWQTVNKFSSMVEASDVVELSKQERDKNLEEGDYELSRAIQQAKSIELDAKN